MFFCWQVSCYTQNFIVELFVIKPELHHSCHFFLITMPIVRHSIKFQGINFVLGFWVVVLLLLGVMGQGMNNNKSSIQFKASQHLSILCTVNKKAQNINVQWCQATAPPTASLPGNVLQFVSVNYVKIN